MYKTIFIILFVFGFCFSQDAFLPRAAILDFDAIGSLESTEAIALTSMFQSAVSQREKFELLSRRAVSKIKTDQDLFNNNDSLAILGRDLSVKKVIIGNIYKIGTKYIVTAKLIDVGSKLDRSVSLTYEGKKEGLAELMDEVAEELLYEPGYFWYYAGATVAIAGGVYAYLFLQEKNEPIPKLPKPPTP